MDRRSLLKGAASLAAGSALPSIGRAAATARHRNVLLLISDDQGLDLGCYGTAINTPRIDQFARGATRFTNGFAAVSSCSPSRAVINTGLFTHQNGMYGLQHDVHHQSLLDGIDTLPAMLRRAGYATALVGKKHIGPDSAFPYEVELVPERSGIR
ncbi:MAG: sulfatase-like hydrolase/transferase, partial [Sphingobium sp.]